MRGAFVSGADAEGVTRQFSSGTAQVGIDLSTVVRAGENRGRMLPQQFVALEHEVRGDGKG
jgi:hypothetical protein